MEKELREFLKEHPKPKLEASSSIIEGKVSCIRPVPTLFGAEIYYNPRDADKVRKLVWTIQGGLR